MPLLADVFSTKQNEVFRCFWLVAFQAVGILNCVDAIEEGSKGSVTSYKVRDGCG